MMRVYALYQRNRWVLGFLVVIAIASVSMACWSILSDKGGSGKQIFIDRYVGCDQIFPDDGAKHYAVAWGGVLMFDTVVFLLTVYRGYKYRRAGRLVIVLMRDGAFYFIVLFLTNLANIFMFLFAPPSLKAASTTFTNVLSAVLITRLMINLKESASPGALPTLDTTMSFDTSGVDTAPFTTIMGDQDAYSLGPWTRGGYGAACPPEEAPRVRWCDGDGESVRQCPTTFKLNELPF
ncbi:hypothetical protein OF83DRAFT_791819 [Amylostereum chailletii]|nr:hypothetical protein OF83DRAFT_791819 [Amylostereum chailletii]